MNTAPVTGALIPIPMRHRRLGSTAFVMAGVGSLVVGTGTVVLARRRRAGETA